MNLALPNSWGAIRRFRCAHRSASIRLHAYAIAPGSSVGAWLGNVDLYFLGSEEGGVLERVRGAAPILKRVMVVDNQPDGLVDIEAELRAENVLVERMTRADGMDSRIGLFQPQAAMIHLAPGCFDAFAAIAVLRGQAVTREIPIVFLLDPTAHPRDIAFFTAGLRTLASHGRVDAAALVSHLSMSLKVTGRAAAKPIA